MPQCTPSFHFLSCIVLRQQDTTKAQADTLALLDDFDDRADDGADVDLDGEDDEEDEDEWEDVEAEAAMVGGAAAETASAPAGPMLLVNGVPIPASQVTDDHVVRC